MKTSKQHFGFSQKVMVLAILAAFGPAHADEDIAQYIKPDSTISGGVGAVTGDSKDRALFGQYNGMRKQDFYGLLDVNYVKRDDASGTWTILQGLNLGLDTRELRFSQQKQGNWKYSAEYSELVRNYQNTINTGMVGAGTATPTVVSVATPGTGTDLDLQTKRKSATLSIEKWIMPSLQFEAVFKNEDKDGARLFGRGLNCSGTVTATTTIPCAPSNSGAILMLPEPIDSTIRQIDAKLNFSGDKFLVSAAYYGSFYTNSYGSLRPTVSGNLYNPNGTVINTATTPGSTLVGYMQQAMALPPDNQAHQFSLAGNYAFTPTTRATFKYAYTHATQNEDFASMGLTGGPAGVSNLGGEVNTSLFQAGLTARPMSKLSLLANVRYEDKDDKTPLNLYSPIAGKTNGSDSMKKLNGKAEASYQLASNYRATLGVDYDTVDFGVHESTVNPGGLSLFREKTKETGYRLELRRSLSETFNGTISYISSKRDGEGWRQAVAGTPSLTDAQVAAMARPVAPFIFLDRTRDKVKLSADWSPNERLSLQFVAEDGTDKYDKVGTGAFKGLGETGATLYSLDALFTLTDDWKLTGYVTQSDQSQLVNHSTYLATLKSSNSTFGLGVVGKPMARLEVGGDLSYTDEKNTYQQGLDVSAQTAANIAFLATTGGLPDVTYRVASLKLFGKYALDKKSGLRFDLIHQRAKWNDWAWGYNGVPFRYTDNTTVSSNQQQNVTFLGVSYIYKFQ